MKYYVAKENTQEYMDLSIDDNDLFPSNAPNGLVFLQLKGELGNNAVLTKESAKKVIDKYLCGEANLERLIHWADTMTMSRLFDWETKAMTGFKRLSQTSMAWTLLRCQGLARFPNTKR